MNKIHWGTNCMDCVEGLKLLKDESIDLTVTSPPYDNLRTYNGYCFDFESVAKELYRVTKLGGVVVWVVGDATVKGSETGTSFKQALYFKEIGFNLHDTMIYEKNSLPMNHNRYEQEFEYMFIFSKGKPKTFNPIMIPCKTAGKPYNSTAKLIGEDNGRRTIDYHVNSQMADFQDWDMAVAQNRRLFTLENGKKLKHPAVFPLDLPLRHIQTWTNEGDLVFDPFMGSGTTAIAAIKLNRNYIGIEKNEDYIQISKILISEMQKSGI